MLMDRCGRAGANPAAALAAAGRLFLISSTVTVSYRNDPEPNHQHEHGHEHRRVREHVARMGERDPDEHRHWFAWDSSHNPKVVKPTITASIQYWDWVAMRAFL